MPGQSFNFSSSYENKAYIEIVYKDYIEMLNNKPFPYVSPSLVIHTLGMQPLYVINFLSILFRPWLPPSQNATIQS